MKKSPRLYLIIIAAWLALTVVAAVPLLNVITGAHKDGWLVTALVGISTAFIIYFWLNGIKDIIYTLYYYLGRSTFTLPPDGEWRHKYGNAPDKRVVAVYCTCNDFNGDSLQACMTQDYPNITFVILD
ncbi:MAG TPA: hypothetical protein VIQ80_01880, partial [Candidatus Saccharimonadales bacterium]